MPTYMDRHVGVDAKDADVAALHALDVAHQEKHGVKYLSYWFDPDAHSVFCFVDAPDKAAAEAVHAEAHHRGQDPAAIAAHRHQAEHPIQLRIGISAGEPVTEHNDLFGAAVQLAARACAQAEPNCVFVSTEVHELYDGGEYDFEVRGPFELKGFEEPIPLYEVSWVRR